jgi:hypothetical protein
MNAMLGRGRGRFRMRQLRQNRRLGNFDSRARDVLVMRDWGSRGFVPVLGRRVLDMLALGDRVRRSRGRGVLAERR